MWMVQRQSAAPASNTIITWGGDNVGILDPTSYTPTQNAGAQGRTSAITQNSAPYTYIPLAIFNDTSTAGENSYDLNAFISKLTQGTSLGTSVQSSSANTEDAITDAYSFTPIGPISTTEQNKRSSAQESIYQYGNTIGSYIQSFEEQYPEPASILIDQADDRANPQKAAAVENLAKAIESVGHTMLTIAEAPQGFSEAHVALAQSYIEVGKNLALIPKAMSDDDFLKAIEVYNASADTFVKNYITLATLLSIYEVTFNAGDAGSVFLFSSAGGF